MIYGTFIQSPYFWYLIFGRQKTSFFLFLMFQELQGPKWKKENCTAGFSSGEHQREEEASMEGHEAQNGWAHAARFPDRVGPTKWSLGHFLAWGFLTRSPSRPKSNALIFTRLSEVAAAAKLLIPSEGGQILLLRNSGEGEIIVIVITSPPWRGRRPLHHHPHQDQHHHHHHHRDLLGSPRSLRVAIP